MSRTQQRSTGAGQRPLGGLGLAARLAVVDRWPTVITRPLLWDRMSLAEAFEMRWLELPIPESAMRWMTVASRASNSRIGATARSQAARGRATNRVRRGSLVDDVNSGPGDRSTNSIHAAVAVDAHWSGASASALPRTTSGDPVLHTDLAATIGIATHGERAHSVTEVIRIVTTWGPGSKGIISVRDPEQVFLRAINVVNDGGTVRFADHSRIDRPSAGLGRVKASAARFADARLPTDRFATARPDNAAAEDQAVADADRLLATVDPRAPFASIHAWRTRDLPGRGRLPDGAYRWDTDQLTEALRSRLPMAVPTQSVEAIVDRIRFMGDDTYSRWICEQVHRGAVTFMPNEIIDLVARTGAPTPPVITRLDEALVRLVDKSVGGLTGPRLTLWVPDDVQSQRDADCFPKVRRWTSRVDGMADGTFELTIDPTDLRRLPVAAPLFELPDAEPTAPRQPITPRQPSWIDVNQAVDRTGRKTNCWNCVAAVAQWLDNAAASTGLPIYRAAPLRTTIPEFLTQVGAIGRPTYIEDRAGADEVARGWGTMRHGLVVAALSRHSTHIFNVLVDPTGEVRYLDGYVGLDGNYNFDSDWERIGMVELGPVAPAHFPASTGPTNAGPTTANPLVAADDAGERTVTTI